MRSVTARPRNSPRARRPGCRAMKRRTAVLRRVLVGADRTPELGSSRNARGERPASRGAQPAQRDPVAHRGPPAPAGWALRRERNGGGTLRAPMRRLVDPVRRARLAGGLWRDAASGRGRAVGRGSRSRSSTLRSAGLQRIAENVELKIKVATCESDESLRNVAVTVETKPRGNDAGARVGRNGPWRRAPGRRTADLGARRRARWAATSSHVNTWSAGQLGPGQEKGELTWKVVRAKCQHVPDRLQRRPGPHGHGPRPPEAGPADASPSVIRDEPVPARGARRRRGRARLRDPRSDLSVTAHGAGEAGCCRVRSPRPA